MAAVRGRKPVQRTGEGAVGVWLRQQPVRKDPALTRERIVRAAVELLDEDGISRLTMRRLAERLSAPPTTLYLHVDTKDDVIDLAVDHVFGEVPLPQAPPGPWRDDITALVIEWRRTMLRHPWTAAALVRPLLGPNVLTRTEYLHTVLRAAGFTGQDLTAAAYALANYVIGAATMQISGYGTDERPIRQAADDYLRANEDRYPTLAAHGAPIGNAWDPVFIRGLGFLLDGIAADAAAAAHREAARPPGT